MRVGKQGGSARRPVGRCHLQRWPWRGAKTGGKTSVHGRAAEVSSDVIGSVGEVVAGAKEYVGYAKKSKNGVCAGHERCSMYNALGRSR